MRVRETTELVVTAVALVIWLGTVVAAAATAIYLANYGGQ